jgi:hypothetical protein
VAKQEKNRMVRVTCEGAETVQLDELLPFQGEIKQLTPENNAKLRTRILQHGINAPVFVWWTKAGKRYILDGHQRCTVLRELRDEGYVIPEVPVVYIDAVSKRDAADKLLAITSQYGQIKSNELQEWVLDLNLNLDSLRIVDTEIDLQMPDFDIASEDEQGKLDHIVQRVVTCPHCGEEFDLNGSQG